VLNGRDEELELLGRLRDESLLAGTHYLVPPAALAPLFNDKYETALFASRHGLPFAETAYSPPEVERLIERRGLPLVAKPRVNGFASRSVFLACEQSEIRAAMETGLYVFQELLPSPLLHASVDDWKRRLGIPWQWSMQSIDHEVDMLLDDDVIALCLSAGLADGALNRDIRIIDEPGQRQVGEAYGRALSKLGHRGPVNLQGRLLPDGRYVPFELNARFTGTMSGKAYLGYNMVLAALHYWCGVPETAEAMAPSGKLVQRMPVTFMPFDEVAAKILADTGEWRKA
jgi:hypothetical protein